MPQLRLHPNGQWYFPKRVSGARRNFYFGKDADAARARYLRELPAILDGRPVRGAAGDELADVTVLEMVDRFIVAQQLRFRSGEIGIREFDDLRRAATTFGDWAGPQTFTDAIPSLDGYRADLKARMQLNSFNRYMTKTRKLLRWAHRAKPLALLREPLHEDDALRKAAKKVVKRERRELEDDRGGAPLYAPRECRALLLAAAQAEDYELLSFVLLGLNAGMGQSHIADLLTAKVDLDALYVDWVRTKSEELFQFTMWPVTAEAIRRTIARRPRPLLPAFEPLLFLTRCGNAWVREYYADDGETIGSVSPNDEIGKAFRKLEAPLAIDGRPMKRGGRAFYALRRTFATIANDTTDKDAVRRIQGQDLTGMDPHYVRAIPVERLKVVTDYVHRVLFQCDPAALSLANFDDVLAGLDRP